MSNYAKSEGGFWPNTYKKTDKQPDVTGNIEVSNDQLRKMVEQAKAGVAVKLQIAGWNRRSKSDNKPYIYISAEVLEPKESAPQPATIQSQFEAQGLAPTASSFPNDDVPF